MHVCTFWQSFRANGNEINVLQPRLEIVAQRFLVREICTCLVPAKSSDHPPMQYARFARNYLREGR